MLSITRHVCKSLSTPLKKHFLLGSLEFLQASCLQQRQQQSTVPTWSLALEEQNTLIAVNWLCHLLSRGTVPEVDHSPSEEEAPGLVARLSAEGFPPGAKHAAHGMPRTQG